MSLQDKLDAWAKSPKGKTKIDAARKEALKDGKRFGTKKGGSGGAGYGAGSGSVAARDLDFYKRAFIEILREKIQDAGYNFAAPENLHIAGGFNESNGYYEYHINFDQDAIHRESLYPDGSERNTDGAYDIVALLNHGYEADGRVYGYWEPAGKVIGSLQSREGLFYIQSAAEAFEQLYGDAAHISYNEKYDKRG